jgi:hypothetical protein
LFRKPGGKEKKIGEERGIFTELKQEERRKMATGAEVEWTHWGALQRIGTHQNA